MAVIKKLTRIGNSYGLILAKDVLQVVGIDPRRGCRLSVDRHRLVVEPTGRAKDQDTEVIESMVRFIKKYRQDLSRLAST